LKILYVGAFDKSSSADFSRSLGLLKLHNKITCFDFRYKRNSSYSLFKSHNIKNLNGVTQNSLNKARNIIRNIIIKINSKINNIKKRITYFKIKRIFPEYLLPKNWLIGRQLINEVKNNKYDLVFFAKINSLNYRIIPKINRYAKTWYYFMDPTQTAIKISADKYASRTTFSNATFSDISDYFNKNGANSYFITEGFDEKLFYPKSGNIDKRIDIVFAGSKSPKREKYIEFLTKNGFSVECYGFGWSFKPLYLDELAEKYRQSKIILNFSRDRKGFSDRVFLSMGSGSFLLSEYCNDIEKCFEKKKHLDWFFNRKELLILLKYYLENPVIREKIAKEGSEYVHNNFTWVNIMKKIMIIVKTTNI